jgi:hypothetical protein
MLIARLGLLLGALIVLLVAGALLVLAARSQMRIQQTPTDLKYAPARPTPVATKQTARTPDEDAASLDTNPAPGIDPNTGVPALGMPAYPMAPVYGDSSQRPMPRPEVRTLPPAQTPTAPPPVATPSIHGTHAAGPQQPAPSSAAQSSRFRRVGDKIFAVAANGFLVDTTFVEGSNLPVVEVVAGSPDYDRLLEQRADLAQYFRLSDKLIVVADNTVYRVVPGR